MLPFTEIRQALHDALDNKLVSRQVDDDTGLELWCYTDKCVFDRGWTPITLMARGLILDPKWGEVVATPFPKFFNLGERDDSVPDLPFETFDKVDGSLIIVFFHAGKWRTATKGSFKSEQAKWAADYMDKPYRWPSIAFKGTTFLLEAVYPANRIVVKYDHEGLYLLGAYTPQGTQYDALGLEYLAKMCRWHVPVRHQYSNLQDMMEHAQVREGIEGWVVRFSNGHRLKIKTDQYKRLHALISRVTPLAVWEAMRADDNLWAWKRELPEEFWEDFDQIQNLLLRQILSWMLLINTVATPLMDKTDKEVGLSLDQIEPQLRRFIFPYKKSGGKFDDPRIRKGIYDAIRPTANRLQGYQPSYLLRRVVTEFA